MFLLRILLSVTFPLKLREVFETVYPVSTSIMHSTLNMLQHVERLLLRTSKGVNSRL